MIEWLNESGTGYDIATEMCIRDWELFVDKALDQDKYSLDQWFRIRSIKKITAPQEWQGKSIICRIERD